MPAGRGVEKLGASAFNIFLSGSEVQAGIHLLKQKIALSAFAGFQVVAEKIKQIHK